MKKTWLLPLFAALALSGIVLGADETLSVFESAIVPVAVVPIDHLVAANLTKLGIEPVLCSDAVFVRRTYLGVLGTLPTWPHSRNWGYAPSGGLGFLLMILLVLVLLGMI